MLYYVFVFMHRCEYSSYVFVFCVLVDFVFLCSCVVEGLR